MREVKEVVLGEHIYKIEMLGSQLGKRVLARLMRIGGKSLAQGGLDQESIVRVFGALFDQVTDENLDFFCNTFMAVTRVTPVAKPEVELVLKDVVDSHFAGKYGEMALWLKECVEVNFGNFLGALGLGETVEDLVSTASLAMKTPSKPSTGPSGASSPKGGVAS